MLQYEITEDHREDRNKKLRNSNCVPEDHVPEFKGPSTSNPRLCHILRQIITSLPGNSHLTRSDETKSHCYPVKGGGVRTECDSDVAECSTSLSRVRFT